MEEVGSFPPMGTEPVTPRTQTQPPYTPRLGVPTPNDYPREWMEGYRSSKYTDIPFYDRWKRGEKPVVARTEQTSQGMLPEPSRMFDTEVENSRAAARCQALESPLAPQTTAIPQSKIASYPREWRNGARSGKYSYIPSYQGWRQGEQPELAQTEQSGPSGFIERPLYENPGPST